MQKLSAKLSKGGPTASMKKRGGRGDRLVRLFYPDKSFYLNKVL